MLASDIISRVQNLFGDSNGIVITPTMILQWITDAELEIARETQCNMLSDIRAASDYYTNRTYGVYLTDLILVSRVLYGAVPLALLANETIDRLLLAETPVGTPQAYYMFGEGLLLFPTPESTDTTNITAFYIGIPGAAEAAEDTLTVPDRYKVDLLNFCVGKAHERNENWRAAEYYQTKFMAGVAQRRFESLTLDDSFTVVGPDYEDVEIDYYGGV